jgi:hypothetical protein
MGQELSVISARCCDGPTRVQIEREKPVREASEQRVMRVRACVRACVLACVGLCCLGVRSNTMHGSVFRQIPADTDTHTQLEKENEEAHASITQFNWEKEMQEAEMGAHTSIPQSEMEMQEAHACMYLCLHFDDVRITVYRDDAFMCVTVPVYGWMYGVSVRERIFD